MGFMPGWIRPTDKVLTAEEVKALPVGSWVTIIEPDRRGEMTRARCQVIEGKRTKKLRCMGLFVTEEYPIRDYENKRYVIDKAV